eukprot:jgi/Mesen1/9492/ME000063S08949
MGGGQIYWGHGVNGIEAASALYFGKHPSLLTLGECAMLAGIIPAPELLSPYRDPSRGKKPQARSLRRMVEAGFLDIGMAQAAAQDPLVLGSEGKEGNSGPWRAPYFVSETARAGWGLAPDARWRLLGVWVGLAWQVVENINLAGIDRVFVVVAAAGKVYLRHCAIRLKKSGTKVPKIELVPAGPMLDLVVRRHRGPAEDLRKEAFKGPKSITKKKRSGSHNGVVLCPLTVQVKNVSTDSLIGKVGRIYMPKQEVGSMALMKPKGVKRERREAAAERAIGKPGLSSKKLTSKDDSNRVAPKRKKIAH